MGDDNLPLRYESSNSVNACKNNMLVGKHGNINNNMQNPFVDGTNPLTRDDFGAINEKQRRYGIDNKPLTCKASSDENNNDSTLLSSSNYDPLHIRSHLYHTLEGLDRYPNYLSRWNNENDIQKLEDTLQYYQDLVKRERQRIESYQNNIIEPILNQINMNNKEEDEKYYSILCKPPESWEVVKDQILHPDIVRIIFDSPTWKNNHHDISVMDVLNGKISISYNVGTLSDIMEEELYDVFSIPILRPEFCQLLQSYIIQFMTIRQQKQEESTDDSSKDNNRSFNRPIDLDVIGLGWINDLLFHMIIQPISRHLFKSIETIEELDWRHGYIVGYTATPTDSIPRTNLVTHTDDSEVTLNICLSNENDFNGGKLEFYGLRGMNNNNILGTYQPKIGKSIIHAGRHFHKVTTITSGNRFVYIIWSRSWKGIRAQSCPCCWLNRRNIDQSCICGPKWN